MSMKHIIEIKTHKVTVTVEHNDKEQLIAFRIDGEITEKFHDWLIPRLPLKPNFGAFKAIKDVTVDKVNDDLTFDRFWADYNNKISNKKRTEKIWNDMIDSEKAKAISFIKKYNRILFENPGQSQKHADTYLRQEPWNN